MIDVEGVLLDIAYVYAAGFILSFVVINCALKTLTQSGGKLSASGYKCAAAMAVLIWGLHQALLFFRLGSVEPIDYLLSFIALIYSIAIFSLCVFIYLKPGPALMKWLSFGAIWAGGSVSAYYLLLAAYKQDILESIDFELLVICLAMTTVVIWAGITVVFNAYKKRGHLILLEKLLLALLLLISIVPVHEMTGSIFSFLPSSAYIADSVILTDVSVVAFYYATLVLFAVLLVLLILSKKKDAQDGFDKNIHPDLLVATGVLAALVSISFSHWHNNHMHGKEVSLLYIEQQIDRRVSRAHLWLEELRNGSESVEWERDIIENLLSARQYVKAALTGESVDDVFSYKADDANLLDVLQSIDRDIEKWYEIVVKHRERSDEWGNEFYIKLENHLFATIDQSLARFDSIAERITKENWRHVKQINQITFLFLATLLFGVFRVYKRNKQQMNASALELESALKEIEFQKLALDEHAVVSVTDRKGNIIYSNPKFTEISQYSAEELQGKDHRILNSNYHSREFFRDLWLTVSRGKIWRGKIRNRRKDGSFYWVDTTIVPFLDKNNQPYQYVSIRNDITLIKEAEERQRNLTQELEHRVAQRTAELAEINRTVEADREALQLMVEGTATATGVDFFNLLVKYLSAVLQVEYVIVTEQLYSMPLKAKTIAVRVNTENKENFEYALEGTPCEEVVINRSAIYARELGHTYKHIPFFSQAKIESYMGVPMSDSRGRILGHIAVFSSKEFNDKHRLKSIMRIFATRAASELERQHVEEQLKKARDRAVAASRSKSEFLANMSHELRTPMHAILSFATMGKDDALASDRDELQHYFARIRQSGDRLMGLLNDLLDLSKLNAGKMTFDFVDQDLIELVKSVLNEYEAMLASKKLSLEVCEPDFNTEIAFDKERMAQVLRNLISNAIKFSYEGKMITIAFTEATVSGMTGDVAAIRMDIIDQGVGIPEDEQLAVFEQFQQSSRTNHNAGGTGLGLAICKEIMLAHNGEIRVVENPEGGAIFQVAIPRGVSKQ